MMKRNYLSAKRVRMNLKIIEKTLESERTNESR
jgi:hypothetical protein